MRLVKQSQFIPLQNVVYFITLPVLVRKIFTFYINDVLLFKCPIAGPKVNALRTTSSVSVILKAIGVGCYPFVKLSCVRPQKSQFCRFHDNNPSAVYEESAIIFLK